MNTMKVYPVAGRLVRHPQTGEPVPTSGLVVSRSPYWLRRLVCGDVTTHPAHTAESDTAKTKEKV